MQFLTIVAVLILAGMTSANVSEEETKNFLDNFGKGIDYLTLKKFNGQGQATTSEIYADERLEDVRKKREASFGHTLIRKERAIHREGSSLKINLVSFHNPGGSRSKRSIDNTSEETGPTGGSRSKRATYNTSTETWPHLIPYMFDSSFPTSLIPKVRRIMDDIMDHVCVTWVEEPDFDPLNNNYPSNAYLKFIGGGGNICGTFLGQGSGTEARTIRTCTSYSSIVHEIFHTLGVIHEQQGPLSLQHLSLARKNVRDGYEGGTYRFHNYPSKIESDEFDGSSIMMYSRRSFSRNGLDIMMALRDDEFDINYGRHISLDNIYKELNTVYKCKERHCSSSHQDCGLGYHTRIKGVCQCVCPDGFDPAHNCQELESETSGPTSWPDIPFTLYAAGVNSCPTGFSPARFDITGTRTPIWFGDPFFSSGYTTQYYMCTRDASYAITNMEILPLGTYCVVKPVNLACNGGFEEGHYVIKSTAAFQSTGTYGDWEIRADDNTTVEMKYCCRDDRNWYYPLEMPRQSKFRLVSYDGQCQMIKGMRSNIGRIAMFNQNGERHNSHPQSWLASYYLVHNFCTYTPPTYGCNEDVTLNSVNTSVDIKTPGFDAGSRESNKRCLYNFNVPKGSRVRISIHTYDIDSSDQFNVRRFNRWARPFHDFSKYYVRQFISEKDFLFLEYWSGLAPSSHNGIHFSADLLIGNCYDGRGRTYGGQKAVSESFEECVPWADAVHCEDFPYSGSESVSLLSSSNFCRNPGDAMERPWCYTSVDRNVCKRSYCDVCNDLNEEDRLSNCAALKANDAQFCTKSLQRFKCAESCSLNLNVAYNTDTGTCGTPDTPSDGTPTQTLETSYNVGDLVSYNCDLHLVEENPTEIQCTQNGWPTIASACAECPTGWTPYGDRCILYTPDLVFVDEADESCAIYGGRLFVLRNSTDVDVIREFKTLSTIPSVYGSSWVNIKMVNGEWVQYDNHSVAAPYLDWSSDAVLDDEADHGCVVMIWEYDTSGNAGKFLPTSCNLALSRTFCEIPRSTLSVCEDKSTFCASTLDSDPVFCRRAESYEVALQYCEKSCGFCRSSGQAQCQQPSSTTYHRTSSDSAIDSGDVMTFACNANLYHTSGDLQRACGVDGQLRGVEPECSSTPNAEDVGISAVLRRGSESPTNKIYLLDVDGFRIPFDGVISHWHFYGSFTGTIYFVVYRHDVATDTFNLVGYNTVSIGTVLEPWTYTVPSTSRIAVEEGDVYGFFTIDGKIAVTTCGGYAESPMTLIEESANSVSELTSGKSFASSSCLIPSLGVRVQP